MHKLVTPLCLGLWLSCATVTLAQTLGASARLIDAQGREVGTATLTEVRDFLDRVQLRVKVSGLPPNSYPMHIHAVGKCTPPDFRSSGGVLSPFMDHWPKQGPPGNLPNLEVGPGGTTEVQLLTNERVTMGPETHLQMSVLRAGGTALVLHAATGREIIACGVITADAPNPTSLSKGNKLTENPLFERNKK